MECNILTKKKPTTTINLLRTHQAIIKIEMQQK
jgi:hypothetical protein